MDRYVLLGGVMRSIAFAILYVGLLLASLAQPQHDPFKNSIAGLCGMAFFLAVVFAVLGV